MEKIYLQNIIIYWYHRFSVHDSEALVLLNHDKPNQTISCTCHLCVLIVKELGSNCDLRLVTRSGKIVLTKKITCFGLLPTINNLICQDCRHDEVVIVLGETSSVL